MDPRFSLLIFDCDGVLVDSETPANRVLAEMTSKLGWPLTTAEAVSLFKGGKLAHCLEVISQRIGRPLPAEFADDYRRRTAEAFRTELRPVPGIRAALDTLTGPKCVASSGPREKIVLSLSLTGLLPYFEPHLFSSYEVGSWKPEPGIFLHAARAFRVAPASCAVIEDSLPGVQAGIAAGMTVFAYVEAQDAGKFAAAGAVPFHDMTDLPRLLNPPADCRPDGRT